jgi:hypothetical protein
MQFNAIYLATVNYDFLFFLIDIYGFFVMCAMIVMRMSSFGIVEFLNRVGFETFGICRVLQ